MTDTASAAPSDAEIDAQWRESVEKHETTAAFVRDFARAVLAHWGQPQAVAVPLTEEQRSDIATAAAGFNWTDDYVEAIDYVIDGVESLHGIKGGQQ